MKRFASFRLASAAFFMLCLAIPSPGILKTWVGPLTNDWFTGSNWSGGTVPLASDDVVLNNPGANVLLSASTPDLTSITLSGNATLTFTNWTTRLNASSVRVETGGLITCSGPYTNTVMSNRVWIACVNLVVEEGGAIDVSRRGYRGGSLTAPAYNGQGPGGGQNSGNYGGGGGHGGKGARWTYPGRIPSFGWDYDSNVLPATPGSGGGADSTTYPGGHGGGAVRVEASGAVLVNGSILADGEAFVTGGSRAGWGGGGAVLIQCTTFAGTNGLISAQGGKHQNGWGGGGGGGRIALHYDGAAQASMPVPRVKLNALGGLSSGTSPAYNGDNGTLYVSDTRVLDPLWLPHNGLLYFDPAVTAWSVDALAATNGWLWLAQTNLDLVVTNDLLVSGAGVHFETPDGGDVAVGGSLLITNGGRFSVHAGATNAVGPDWGALVAVTGDLVVATNSTLVPCSQERNGGSPLFRAANLRVAAGGTVDGTGRGFRGGWDGVPGYDYDGYGPGHGWRGASPTTVGSGGGYGGKGGDGGNYGGVACGSVTNPILPGSGGASRVGTGNEGGPGGGLFRLETEGTATVDGTITCAGTRLSFGGGSGGGVLILCSHFEGSGAIRVDGGAGDLGSGAGGGGRIALHYATASPGVVFSASPGVGPAYASVAGGTAYYPAGIGSLYFPDATFLDPVVKHTGLISIPGFTAWSVDSLVLTNNACAGFAWDGFALTVTNGVRGFGGRTKLLLFTNTVATVGGDCVADVDVMAGARLTVAGDLVLTNHYDWGSWVFEGAELHVGGDLILTNSPVLGLNNVRLRVLAGSTNGVAPDYGALVSVTGAVTLCSNAWVYAYSADAFSVYPYNRCTNGGSPLFRFGSLKVEAQAGFNADGKGWRRGGPSGAGYTQDGYGPGGGRKGSASAGGGGGGFGGPGGAGNPGAGGTNYGLAFAPLHPGSGGALRQSGEQGADGGGLIRIEAEGAVQVDGTLTANGSTLSYAGGSGGGIFVDCGTFAGGPAAILRANGGNGAVNSGGGGGGRIAVWTGTIPADAGDKIRADLAGEVALLEATNQWPAFTGALFVNPGTGYRNGETGTVAFLRIAGGAPEIENRPASGVSTSGAVLNGFLLATGSAPATVTLYWGEADGGASRTAWARTNLFPGTPDPGPLAAPVALPPDTTFYYRYFAENGAGSAWSPTTEVFNTGVISLTAPAPDAYEAGQAAGTVTVSRAAWATNAAVLVSYTIGGTAVNGEDYFEIGTSALLAAGQAEASVAIRPITDALFDEDPETVILTLTGGAYAAGDANAATVTIANAASVGEENAWIGGTGLWAKSESWSGGFVPVAGQRVTVTGQVLLAASTAPLASLTVLDGRLVVSNWSTVVRATNVTLAAGGILGLPGAFTNNAVSNRIWIVCSNLLVEAGGRIDADRAGYDGGVMGVLLSYPGQGPGGGGNQSSFAGGAGHGGKGARWTYPGAGMTNGWDYGIADEPSAPGSGGGAHADSMPGGDGGGVIRIEAEGDVIVHGAVSANGETYPGVADNRAGWGSGGSIFIACRTFGGTGGVVRANGGRHLAWWGGGGGGGRVAVVFNGPAQALAPRPAVAFSALGGPDSAGNWTSLAGENGTLYFTDAALLDGAWLPHGGIVHFAGVLPEWAMDQLVVTNGWLRMGTNLAVIVTNGVVLDGAAARFETGPGGELRCGGVLVTNGGTLMLRAGPTNETTPYGGLLDVRGDLRVATNSAVFVRSDAFTGGSVLIRAGSLGVDAGGLVSADALGFRGGLYGVAGYRLEGYGPGGGVSWVLTGSGGGHGGAGGNSSEKPGGVTNDAVLAPVLAGSGGASRQTVDEGGYGGGVVSIDVEGAMRVDGTLSANGGTSGQGGGGAGGTIRLNGRSFSGGPSARLRAEGGSIGTASGAGGGGRIAVWVGKASPRFRQSVVEGGKASLMSVATNDPAYLGALSVAPGSGGFAPGGLGTVFIVTVRMPGTILILR